MPGPEVKFCGLTRAEDAAMAAALGARYAGVIFAHGPRLLDVPRARAVFAGLGDAPVERVGVFAAAPVSEILRIADGTRLHVLQLHDGGTPDRILSLRNGFAGAIWTVVRVSGARLDGLDPAVLEVVDGVVLDTAVGGRTGGTGVAFDWVGAAEAVRALAERTTVVLAGGLRAGSVTEAVRLLAPRVVDVSSGVESAPGVKDHEMMRAFAEAVRLREDR